MQFMKVKLADVLPNPYRNLGSYNLQTDRLEALKGSIMQTGFWANVMARPAGDTVEIAYGHHRIEAAKQVLGEDYVHTFPVADLNDFTMLQMMAAENSEAWMNTTAHDNETVAAARDILNDYMDEYPTWQASYEQAKGPIHGISSNEIMKWFGDERYYTRAVKHGVGAKVIGELLRWKTWKVDDALANLPLDARAAAAIKAKEKEAAKQRRAAEKALAEAEALAKEARDDQAKAEAEAREQEIQRQLDEAERKERIAQDAMEEAGALDTKAVEEFPKQSHAKAFRQVVTQPRFRKQLPVKKQKEFAKRIKRKLGDDMTAKTIEQEANRLINKGTPKMAHLDPAVKYGHLISQVNGACKKMDQAFIDLRDVCHADKIDHIPNMPYETLRNLEQAIESIHHIFGKFGMKTPMHMFPEYNAIAYELKRLKPEEAEGEFIDGEVING